MFQFTINFSKEYKYIVDESLKKRQSIRTSKVQTVNFKQGKGKAEDAPRREDKRVAQTANSKSIPCSV
jgi:hypothetical protein